MACVRKAALCFINAGDFAQADEVLRSCAVDEAATQYLLFLAAIKQGLEDKAIAAVRNIVRCPDLVGKQLLLMASLSHDKGYSNILRCTLDALVMTIKAGQIDPSLQVETIAVVRCLIRLTLIELDKAKIEQVPALLNSVKQHFELTLDVLEADDRDAKTPTTEMEWLYKTAFNTAISYADYGDQPTVTDIFNVSGMLMELYEKASPSEAVDIELPINKAAAKFACLCGKLFVYREMPEGDDKAILLQQLAAYLPQCRFDCQCAWLTKAHVNHLDYMLRVIDVFEIEILATSRDWDGVTTAMIEMIKRRTEAGEADPDSSLETAADVLLSFANCPSEVTLGVIEVLLDAYSMDSLRDATRVARWIRAVLVGLLGREDSESEKKALHYVQKALDVLRKEDSSIVYPRDEIAWLAAQTWNTGLEKANSVGIDHARAWCGLALALAPYTPEGAAALTSVSCC
ncbi:hypothetical protein BCR39DRAFT_535556 [Naematelia encephala]|uniref:Meiosis protein SPO22/ZIP4 like-domain-containing protein n=1 Tax=Naematelia encephala TaxID=71784 RepID=A0A1Y2B215_9TREE|nr:hypothetical protein BCR39DRAFT_535556 [Naematelia encephala]